MFALFFTRRPVFAMVLSIATVLVGVLALTVLPIAQYPNVVPPQVVVTAIYPGADAKTVSETVAAPIEEQINGVENLLYMESQSTNDGAMRLVLTFKVGTNPDQAQVLVQNRVSIATPKLPDVVKQIGVVTKKQSTAILLVVTMFAEEDPATKKPKFEQLEVSNYAKINVKDELAKLDGVGDVFMFGEREYSMRVWLDPNKMADYQLTGPEVVQAIRAQNQQVAAGQIGAPPAPTGQSFQLVLTTRGRLPDEKAFENIVVKSGPAGEQLVYLRDVVREKNGVEFGARSYDSSTTLDGRPSVGMPIFQLPGANAFDTARLVRAKMIELQARFPDGMKYSIVFDPTTFVQASVEEVVKTLFEAIALVAIVVLLFLQNWRAALIPMLAVPVALIGTFAALAALGYSINNLTLFGLVLAIGIVVDDAIVVVEAVEVNLAKGMTPLAATEQAMREVGGAIIGVSLVLVVVFVPCAFIPGLTGQFFRQFAVTIAVSTVISAFNSLTLSPALCPILLKGHGAKRDPFQWLIDNSIGRLIFKPFNWTFDKITSAYGWSIGRLIRISLVVLAVYIGLLVLTGIGFTSVPSGFIPQQDQGYLVINAQLPDGATVERSEAVMRKVTDLCIGPLRPDGTRDTEKGIRGVEHVTALSGYSIFASANISSAGGAYLSLSPFAKRKGRHADAILKELNEKLQTIQEGRVDGFGAPPILGLGNAGGFKLQLQDRGNLGLGTLEGMAWNLIGAMTKEKGIPAGFTAFSSGAPQLYLEVNSDRCFKMGIPDQAVKDALAIYLGGVYVNDITTLGRNWQVNVQADLTSRTREEDIQKLKVRAPNGEMVSLAGLVDIRKTNGPTKVNRFNMIPSADVNGVTVAAMISSGEAIAKVETIAARELPEQMTYQWTDMAYQQVQAANTRVAIPGVFEFTGDTTLLIFGLSVLLAFLVLAAQYESWLLPLAVVLIVPMCLLSAVVGLIVVKLDLNIFTQIGLVVLVGLASKNAILIVESAKQKRAAGMPRRQATIEAARLRLRPILMTSFAFILGVLPLVIAEGAGAEMRRSLGTAVFSGMLGVTFFGIFFTPVFYFVLDWLRGEPAPVVSTTVAEHK